MRSIAKNADLHLGPGNTPKLHCSAETLVLLGIVVFQADLQLDRFRELPGLVFRALEDRIAALVQGVSMDLAVMERKIYRFCNESDFGRLFNSLKEVAQKVQRKNNVDGWSTGSVNTHLDGGETLPPSRSQQACSQWGNCRKILFFIVKERSGTIVLTSRLWFNQQGNVDGHILHEIKCDSISTNLILLRERGKRGRLGNFLSLWWPRWPQSPWARVGLFFPSGEGEATL